MRRYPRKRKPLNWSMVIRLLFGWFLPLLLMILLMIIMVSQRIDDQITHTITTSGEKAVEICTLRLEDCTTASKNASYLPTLREGYQYYQRTGSWQQMEAQGPTFLKEQYKYNPNFRMAYLYMTDEPEKSFHAFNYASGGSYENVRFFAENVQEKVEIIAEDLDTATALINAEGRLYLVRNLMKSNFEPYGVLTMEVNEELLFESLQSVWGFKQGSVFVNGELLTNKNATDEGLIEEATGLVSGATTEGTFISGDLAWYVQKVKMQDNEMTYVILLDKTEIYSEMGTVRGIFILLIVFMIPLFFQIFLFFRRKVTKPLQELVDVSKELEQGHYGREIENTADSAEFYYTNEVFNAMSRQLQNQFEKIYLEEIALRDARIMALQSQINPHFLNNTLEIINWEARLNENYKVSGMIEALSVMLEATMNRTSQQNIPLCEELSYVDAYLYIISQRFGEKFHYEKEVDPELMEVRLPRLIVQPIVENAVEHGMNISKQGQIIIRIFKEREDFMVIEVEDNGELTKEQEEKIYRLLSTEADKERQSSVSLGIRNVNQRLKIIYGEECGLYFYRGEKGHTVSRLVLKLQEDFGGNQ